MRLIDADKLRKTVKENLDDLDVGSILAIIDNAPTVDAIVNTIEVRPQGRWIQTEIIDDDSEYGVNDDASECSNCKHIESSHYWTTTYYHYCPNCGARMGGENNETN